MNRNEYRRAFIMLRAVQPGYGGHVRLERRTLTGSLYFIVTAPQGVEELQAALVGRQGGDYFAAPVGRLARDRRGQLALAWQFDPRDIQGRPLEAYSWVAVAATGGPCAVALTGNVEGSRAVDPAALDRAVCALFEPGQSAETDAPAAELPGPDELISSSLDDSAFVSRQTRYEPIQSEAADDEAQCDIKIYTGSRSRRQRSEAQDIDQPPATPDRAESEPRENTDSRPITAARRLGLDITKPWPEPVEPLRRLFATQAPLDTPLGDGFVYISAPMPEGSGLGVGIAGLRAEAGRITAVRYALPGRRSPEPPAGLEEYRWLPAVGEDGYWVLTSDLSG